MGPTITGWYKLHGRRAHCILGELDGEPVVRVYYDDGSYTCMSIRVFGMWVESRLED
jgi:hypothetical protein